MLTLATVRARWASFIGTFTALALGVALIATTLLVLVSAAPRLPERYAGSTVLVRSPAVSDGAGGPLAAHRPWSASVAEELANRLARVDGVTAALVDRSFYAQAVLDGAPAGEPRLSEPQGHGWASAALARHRLTAGRAPERDGEVVLDRALKLAPGAPVTLLTAAGPAEYTVVGTVDGAGFYVADAAAARLAGGIEVIGLRTLSGIDLAAVKAVVGSDGEVLAGDARKELEPAHEATIRWISAQVLGAMASLAGFVSIFVVASTFAFGVHQRRRELGLLRAVGATPGQVRRMMFGEALVVGTVAATAGAGLAVVFAPLFGEVLEWARMVRPGFETRISWWPLAAAVGVGVLVALLGVVSASRRAARVRPLEALREAAVEKRPMTVGRWIFGGLFLAGGAALVVATAAADAEYMLSYALYSAMTLMVALTLLAPVIIPPLVRAVCWPLARRRGATGMLVREGSLVAVRRIASTAAPVLVTVGFTVLITGMVATSSGAYATETANRAPGDTVLLPDRAPGLSDAAVRGTASGLTTDLFTAADHLPALGVDAATLTRLGLAPLGGPDRLAVTNWVAEWHGWARGDTVPMTLADGTSARLRIDAVFQDGAVPTSVLLDRAFARAHDPSALTEVAYVDGAGPGPDRALGTRTMGVAEWAAVADADEEELISIFVALLIAISMGYTAIAIVNTMLMATADRVRDFAALRLSGATARQVLRTVAAEAALVVCIGAGIGMVVALAGMLGVRSGLAAEIDAPVALVLPWPAIGGVLAACFGLALVGSLVPARFALRRPASALAGERT